MLKNVRSIRNAQGLVLVNVRTTRNGQGFVLVDEQGVIEEYFNERTTEGNSSS